MGRGFAAVFILAAAMIFANSTVSFADEYDTNVGIGYDLFTRAGGENSAAGLNIDISRFIRNYGSGRLGVGGAAEFIHFAGDTLKQYEAFVSLQGRSQGSMNTTPFGRFGIGVDSSGGETDMLMDFGAGVDFLPKTTWPVMVRVMLNYKRVFAEGNGFNVVRFSVGVVVPLGKK